MVDHQQLRRRRFPVWALVGVLLVLGLVVAGILCASRYWGETTSAQGQAEVFLPVGPDEPGDNPFMPKPPKATPEESYLYGPLVWGPKWDATFVVPASGRGTFWHAVRDKVLPALMLPSGLPSPAVDAEADRIAGNVLRLARQQLPGVDLDNLPAQMGGYPVVVRLRS